MKDTINIDWLCFNAYCTDFNRLFNTLKSTDNYIYEAQEVGTMVYNKRYYVIKDREKIATLLFEPISSLLNKNLIQIQIANKFLYAFGLKKLCNEIINDLCVTFHSFSRIDICIDTDTYIDLEPQEFIKKFASNEIIKLGKTKGYLPFKSNKGLQFSGITFKNKDSITSFKIYNKSLEMRETHEKKYIRESWIENGYNGEKDVYRIEVSLKNFSQQMLSINDIFVFTDLNTFLNYTTIPLIFFYYINRSFKFAYNENKKNVSENKKVRLITIENASCKLIKLNGRLDTSRNTRIMINELFLTIAKAKQKEVEEVEHCLSSLIFLLKKYDLEDWFEQKYNVDTTIIDKYRMDLFTPVSTELFVND